MIIRREHTAQAYSDDSYGGLGGWSPQLGYFWRILAPDMEAVGFDLSKTQSLNANLREFNAHATHINILEIVAIAINLWLVIHFIRSHHEAHPGGNIVAIVAENTSALSWLRFASRGRAHPSPRTLLSLSTHSVQHL
jgi:hypothetical protein